MKPRILDRIAVTVFVLALLAPMAWRGIVSQRRLPCTPRVLDDLQNISCLFANKPTAWNSFYVQFRGARSNHWETIDHRQLFRMEPFGNRSRFHRFMAAWNGKPGRHNDELAEWIFVRWAELHPDEAQPVALRFARVWSVPDPEPKPTEGWSHPRFEDVPTQRRKIISTHMRGDTP